MHVGACRPLAHYLTDQGGSLMDGNGHDATAPIYPMGPREFAADTAVRQGKDNKALIVEPPHVRALGPGAVPLDELPINGGYREIGG